MFFLGGRPVAFGVNPSKLQRKQTSLRSIFLGGMKPGFRFSSLKVHFCLENWGPKMYFCKFHDSYRSICFFHLHEIQCDWFSWGTFNGWFVVDLFDFYFISFHDKKYFLPKETPNIWIQCTMVNQHFSTPFGRICFLFSTNHTVANPRSSFDSFIPQNPTMWIVGIRIHHARCFSRFHHLRGSSLWHTKTKQKIRCKRW